MAIPKSEDGQERTHLLAPPQVELVMPNQAGENAPPRWQSSFSCWPRSSSRNKLVRAFFVVFGVLVLGTILLHVFIFGRRWMFPSSSSASSTSSSSSTSWLPDGPGMQDRIVNLPGLDTSVVKEAQFSGYLPIRNGGRMHYWLVLSQSEQAEHDPLVIWLNGGPGASSLGGLFYENGPFTIQDDGITLKRNPHAWNQHANLLYLEAPLGVGFSYNLSTVYETNDDEQALDNYEALLQFFLKFPQLQRNELFVTGESYGGMYVPTFCQEILRGNERLRNKMSKLQPNYSKGDALLASSAFNSPINLVGFAVGNGVNEFTTNSQLYYAYYHGLLDDATWKDLHDACDDLQEFSPSKLSLFDLLKEGTAAQLCGQRRMQALAQVMMSLINTYDIYGKCTHGNPMFGMDQLLREVLAPQPNQSSDPLLMHPLAIPLSMCMNATAGTNYLNRDDVKLAIHVPLLLTWSDIVLTNATMAGFQALNVTLDPSRVLYYGMNRHGEVTQLWRELLKHGVRGTIYHGDADFMCDFVGGSWAVASLNLPVKKSYQPWYINDERDGSQQVAGFVKEYEANLTFLTIRGAGHMVPQWKPVEAIKMFHKYVLRREE